MQSKLRLIDAQTVALSGFDLFWEIYPRKRSKLDALKAWNQTQGLRPAIEEVIAAVHKRLATGEWRDLEFIPFPATWLRKGGWMDE